MRQKLNDVLKDLYVISGVVPVTEITHGCLSGYIQSRFVDPNDKDWALKVVTRHVSNWKALDPESNADELDHECLAYLCVATLYKPEDTNRIVRSVVHSITQDPYVPPTFIDLVRVRYMHDRCREYVKTDELSVTHLDDGWTETLVQVDRPIKNLLQDRRSWLHQRIAHTQPERKSNGSTIRA